MKIMKSMKKYLAIAAIAFSLAGASPVQANPCDVAYNACWTGVNNGEIAARNSYWAQYNAAVNSANNALVNGQAMDWEMYYLTVGLIDSTYAAFELDLAVLYTQVATIITSNYNAIPAPTCQQTAQYVRDYNHNAIGLPNAIANSRAQQAWIDGIQWNLLQNFEGGLWALQNIYNKAVEMAGAELHKKNVKEDYDVGTLYDACWTAWAVCSLNMDCAANPPNCCVDGCAIAFYQALHSAVATRNSYLAGRYSEVLYDIDAAYADRNFKYNEAYRNEAFSDQAAVLDYNYEVAISYNLMVYTIAYNGVNVDYDIAIGFCNGVDLTIPLRTAQALADATTIVSYYDSVALFGLALNASIAIDAQDRDVALDEADNECALIVLLANGAITEMFDWANVNYNVEVVLAGLRYNNCLKGCGG